MFKMTPGRLICLGFLCLILVGSVILMLPISHAQGAEVTPLDALFTSTSAVCVTGLVSVDTGASYSVFGRAVIGVLIQLGGLGITTFGLGLILIMRKKAGIKEMVLAKESFNLSTMSGIVGLIKTVFFTSLAFELVGALLCLPVFLERYSPVSAIGYSLFHSVASFNNSGFDIFGSGDSMYYYIDHVYLNVVTMALIVFGGIGFFVMSDVIKKRSPKKYTLHTKVVLSCTAVLIIVGALLLKLAQGSGISWLSAFFTSVSARTAGFATVPMSELSNAGLMIMNVLMVIGASPGSTGGGIKTTTAFVLLCHLRSFVTNTEPVAYKRKIPEEAIKKALAVIMLALCVILLFTTIICMLEPDIAFRDILFEVCSGFGTAGLSTGITGGLSVASKLIIIVTMYIGRLGPLTIATLWAAKGDTGISRAEGSIQIG